MSEEETGTVSEEQDRLSRRLFWPGVVLLILLLVLLVLWTQRAPIADNLINRELMRRNVPARYDIASIGLRTQRLENLRLGNPADPDLTARWVEVDIALGGLSPHVAAIRAGGVRLRGRIVDGQLRLGELDKFRDMESKAPFSLPDLRLGLEDARLRIDTPAGPADVRIEGRGNLQSGFAGRVAVAMAKAELAGCEATAARLDGRISVTNRHPHLEGPLRAAALRCPATQVALAEPYIGLDLGLNEAMDHWDGEAGLSAARAMGGGAAMTALTGHVSFAGDSRATEGRVSLDSKALASSLGRFGHSEMNGRYALGKGREGTYVRLAGDATLRDIHWNADRTMAKLRAASAGTPVEPLAKKLAMAIREAGRDNRAQASFQIAQTGGRGRVDVAGLSISSASGAHAAMNEGSRVGWSWPGGSLTLDGTLRLAGGGLPEAAVRLRRADDGALSGQMFMRDYVAGTARLGLDPVRFVARGRGGSHFTTALRLDGPLPGGGLRGLALPIDGTLAASGEVRINPACVAAGFAALRYESLALGRTAIRLCPVDGAMLRAGGRAGVAVAADLPSPRLQGRLGDSPIRLAADHVRLGSPAKGFAANALTLSLGAEAPTVLELARLTGSLGDGGMSGALEGGSGHIGNVPLLMSDAAGTWRFARGRLSVEGGMRVVDAASPDRFNPLRSKDFALTLEKGRIAAGGTLTEPRTGATVTKVRIAHDLSSGAGQADLLIDGLTFGDKLQPEDITRLTLGVVANVHGAISGEGLIRWNREGVTSSGRFATQDASLAAAFGPVTGLSGEVHFSDLLALETPPGQMVRLASVNPGIEATDGVVHYQLLSGQRVRIEDGKWPFAGGVLSLEPTVMDFSAQRPRALTFRIIGLQAADFINQLELENIAATGTFDGLLPMIFDANGGRIVGGVLVARQQGLPPLYVSDVKSLRLKCDPNRQGGTLAYVGQVSNADLGMFGKLAFDALKSLRYKCLTILMDGDLDGEVVTQVAFNGVNQDPTGRMKKGMFRAFVGLPFIFNVKIEAPFRGLLNSAASFTNPGLLIRSHLNDMENGLAVQPAESDNKAKRDNK